MRCIKQQNQGFTLIELVVVLVILGILSAIALPKYIDFTGQASREAAKANADSMQLAHSTAMGLLAVSNPSNPYPTLENLVGASGQVRPAVPSGWSNNSTPPAATAAHIYSVGFANYLGAGSPFYTDNPANTDPAAFAAAYCAKAFGGDTTISGYAEGNDAVCRYNNTYTPAMFIGTYLTGSGIPWTCSSGYTISGSTCNLSNAAAVSCPTGYTLSGSSCDLTNPADAGSAGRLPLALNNSGVCVGPNLKAPTWTDQARTTATSAVGSTVRQIDVAPVTDATNCPPSLFP